MTENKIKPTMEQTIYCLKAESERYPEVCEECQLYGEVGCDHCYDDTNDMAIKFLKELEQYRAIGLTPELIEAMQGHNIALINDLGEYQSIGTVEEFKALKEKSLEKKPIYSNFDENEAGEIIPYKAVCPICGNEFEFGTWNDEENHHCVCGQKLDWSE